MSKKQEYIANINYQNNLPEPTIPPTLIKYKNNDDEDVGSAHLITSLYSKVNVNNLIKINEDLGMELDLLKIPGVLNNSDLTFLNGFDNIKLDEKDKILLRDPGVDRLAKSDLSKVSFLRRTEYVSTSIVSHNDSSMLANKKRGRLDNNIDDADKVLNTSEIVERIESSFDKNNSDLEKLRHPIKKKLTAVKSWNFLPDTASMDQNYFILRLVGSAKLDAQERSKLALDTAVFRPVELEEDDWISMYTTDSKDSKLLANDLERTLEDTGTVASDNKTYPFKRLRDFDMQQMQSMEDATATNKNEIKDVALVFNDEKNTVYYKPIRSRIELKRRRVNDVIKQLVNEHKLDQINVKLRNPTTNESSLRDKIRTRFDPIDFPYVEEEIEVSQIESQPSNSVEQTTDSSINESNSSTSLNEDTKDKSEEAALEKEDAL
ncbi:hypothetical protein TPHA_0I02710 [Tetrapisispora phaffii CBS 4417]|uniref:Uncharacterized protein n=1 Tax=Tetrapisispora phaffii (strain ATCC 24235 / CBS 4417 / NBRC 1672 / NRRL Y-8282 / UCD 70-5) TaxID=1071381 RepID=G8BXZ4_TETPH|nr:hypothetical protein TPHA_0I02710 [Tetrapisispora phaffii CBS 4417]CCE64772.1 hypothetical protein TPHA_0I02710 [Tetrapisispora phaffii CBS 4417]